MGSRSLKGGKLGDAVVGMEELWESKIVRVERIKVSRGYSKVLMGVRGNYNNKRKGDKF